MIQISDLKFVDELRKGNSVDMDAEKRLAKHLHDWLANFDIEGEIKVVNKYKCPIDGCVLVTLTEDEAYYCNTCGSHWSIDDLIA